MINCKLEVVSSLPKELEKKPVNKIKNEEDKPKVTAKTYPISHFIIKYMKKYLGIEEDMKVDTKLLIVLFVISTIITAIPNFIIFLLNILLIILK